VWYSVSYTTAKPCNLPVCFQTLWEIKHPVIEVPEMFILEQDCFITSEQFSLSRGEFH
jgi:hypothetical protein